MYNFLLIFIITCIWNWLSKEEWVYLLNSQMPFFISVAVICRISTEVCPEGPKVRLHDSSLLISSTFHCSSHLMLSLLGGFILIKPRWTEYHRHSKTQMDVSSFVECQFTFRQHCPFNIPLLMSCLLGLRRPKQSLEYKLTERSCNDALIVLSTSSLDCLRLQAPFDYFNSTYQTFPYAECCKTSLKPTWIWIADLSIKSSHLSGRWSVFCCRELRKDALL